MEQVKKEVKNKHFYLKGIVQKLKLGFKPADISKELNISKQALQYYINLLKQEGIIVKRGYGVWQVKKEVKDFSIGLRPKTNLHALNIHIPILEGKIHDKDWQVKNKLRNWIPKYKGLNLLGGLKIRNNNNKSINVFVSARDIGSLEEVNNLSFKVKTYIHSYFKKEGVILDIFNCKVNNLNLATQDRDSRQMMKKGERFELDLNQKAEKIFPKDDRNAKAWLDNSPKPGSAETNDLEWKREYLSMPFRIRDMFGLIDSQLKLLDVQTRSTTALAENIKSHIPAWMSNRKIEKEIKRFNKLLTEKQKKLGDWL